MQVEEVDISNSTFTPVAFTITIETKKELMALWHRTNMGEFTSKYKKDYKLNDEDENTGITYELWQKLNEIVDSID